MRKKRVWIDVGHGGNDTGAVCGKLIERDLNLRLAKEVKKLIPRDYSVKLSRTTNKTGTYQQSVKEANAWQADVFVSIHHNAASSSAKGIELLVYSGQCKGYSLASYLKAKITQAGRTPNRGIKIRPDLFVLRHTNMPAVLVESAFITCADSNEIWWCKKDGMKVTAKAIADGVLNYLKRGA